MPVAQIPRAATFEPAALENDVAGPVAWTAVALDVDWKRRRQTAQEKERLRKATERHLQLHPVAAGDHLNRHPLVIENTKSQRLDRTSCKAALPDTNISLKESYPKVTDGNDHDGGCSEESASDDEDGSTERLKRWSDDDEEPKADEKGDSWSFRSQILQYTLMLTIIAMSFGNSFMFACKIFWVGQLAWLCMGFTGPLRGVFLARSVVAVMALIPVVPSDLYPSQSTLIMVGVFWAVIVVWIACREYCYVCVC